MDRSPNLIFIPATELSEMVLNYPRTLLFLEHFDIRVPFGSVTVADICAGKKLNLDLFIILANLYIGKEFRVGPGLSYSDLPTIIRYLRNNHTYYLDEIYPAIQHSIKIIQDLNDIGEIRMIDRFFREYFDEVREHLDYEDNIAFTYISGLHDNLVHGSPYKEQLSYSVIAYKDHHNDIEVKPEDLMNLVIRYLPQKNDQYERRKLFHYLVELDYDLNVHSRIEEQILIPLVEEAERHMEKFV